MGERRLITGGCLLAAVLLQTQAKAAREPQVETSALPCAAELRLEQIRCDQVDNGSRGPFCAEPIGYEYDVWEGLVCTVLLPVAAPDKSEQVEHRDVVPRSQQRHSPQDGSAAFQSLRQPLTAEWALHTVQLDRPGTSPIPSLFTPG